MASTPIRLCAAAALAVVTLAALAGCGGSNDPQRAKPGPKFTKQMAQDKSIEYLQKTLKALPAGAAFSLHPQNHSLGALTPGIEHQCSDSDAATPGNSPSQMQYSYWLIGVPEGKDHAYVGKIDALWHSWGLVRGSGSSSSYAAYTAKDGYTFSIQDAATGTGSISVGVNTPCMLPKNLGHASAPPVTIKRPKS